MSLRTTLAVLAACTLTLTACGGSGSSKKDDGPGLPLNAAEKTVVDYYTKVVDGDDSACALETKTFTAAQNTDLRAADCPARVQELMESYKSLEIEFDIAASTVTAKAGANKNEAIVDITFPDDIGEATHRLLAVDGKWLIEEDLQDGADKGSNSEESDAQVKAWTAKWCSVKLGISKADLVATMGKPTGEKTDEDGELEVFWKSGAISFSAWFEASGKLMSISNSGPEFECEAGTVVQ